MNTAESILSRIVENPEEIDGTDKAAYCDAMEEAGHADVSAFVQQKSRKIPTLWAEDMLRWTHHWPEMTVRSGLVTVEAGDTMFYFAAGFLTGLSVHPVVWANHWSDMTARHPITVVSFHTRPPLGQHAPNPELTWNDARQGRLWMKWAGRVVTFDHRELLMQRNPPDMQFIIDTFLRAAWPKIRFFTPR